MTSFWLLEDMLLTYSLRPFSYQPSFKPHFMAFFFLPSLYFQHWPSFTCFNVSTSLTPQSLYACWLHPLQCSCLSHLVIRQIAVKVISQKVIFSERHYLTFFSPSKLRPSFIRFQTSYFFL